MNVDMFDWIDTRGTLMTKESFKWLAYIFMGAALFFDILAWTTSNLDLHTANRDFALVGVALILAIVCWAFAMWLEPGD